MASEAIERAVIMAAGFGTRLRPLTEKTPKPLLTVNGKRIIDTIIDALYENEIKEIYVIRGYLADQFDELKEKYPDLHMLNNLFYDRGNNILSACLAGGLIENAYVMPADIYINNSNVFKRIRDYSGVIGYKVNQTDDWCIETDINGRITRLSPGGRDCYKDTGIFYWDSRDGKHLSKRIYETCKNRDNWKRYWSNVPFELYKDEFQSYILPCEKSDVIEIDTIEDLVAVDASYMR